MNTDINNNEQMLNEAEKNFKASMFDVIVFYQKIMKELEMVIFNGKDLTNSQAERDTWAEFHELLSNVILDTNALMSSLTPLHEKAKQCLSIIQQRTVSKPVVKVEEDEALHEVTSVVSESVEKDDHNIQDLEKQVGELKAMLEKTTSSLEETINDKIGEVKKDVEDHEEKIIGIIDKKIIPEVSGTVEEVTEVEDDSQKVIAESDKREVQEEPVAEVATPAEETKVVDNGPQKVIIEYDDREVQEEPVAEVATPVEETKVVDNGPQKVIIEYDDREVQEEPVAEVATPVEETTGVDNGPQKVIIEYDDREVQEEPVAEVATPVEETKVVDNGPQKVIIEYDDREVQEEPVAEVATPVEETKVVDNGPQKVIIEYDDREVQEEPVAEVATPGEMSGADTNVNPAVDVSQGETPLVNDIVIQENPEVSVPVDSAVSEISEPVVEQPVQSVGAEQQTTDANSMMPSFSEIPAVNEGVLMAPTNELIPEPAVPAIVSSQQVERPTKVFATSVGYKGNALSVNPTQAANLRKSKEEQLAKIIPIIPYLGIGENTSIETPQPVVANTVPMTEMPPMSESDYTNVSEEELAKMVNQVSVLYNEQRYEEAEALSQKISELNKRFSAQGEKVLSKEYPTQMVA